MTGRPWIGVMLALGATIGGAARSIEAKPDRPNAKALVAATQAYVENFESKLAYGVFDEDYVQHVTNDAGSSARRIHGELFLTFLAADDDWVAVHDVAEVDGSPVADHQSLAALLDRGPLESIKREVIDRNAQYNIGTINRNFNEPTLALLVLAPKRVTDFDFSVDRVEDDGKGLSLATLAFRERGIVDLTLVRGPGGGPAHSKGHFVVEIATGRIRETQFLLDPAGMTVSLTTAYARDDKSDLWLPSVFDERYEQKKNPKELVTCEARYTNFRRFEVLGRIK